MAEEINPSRIFDVDRFGVVGPENRDDPTLPPPANVLSAHAEPLPDFLKATQPPTASADHMAQFFTNRVVYYPGSGTDGHALEVFGGAHAAHCFVYADFDVTGVRVAEALSPSSPEHFKGYAPVHQEALDPPTLQALLGLNLDHPFPPQDSRFRGGIWVILQRMDAFPEKHGPQRIAFLHVCAEGVWTYWNLWGRRRKHTPYGLILQDHGFGGNWCHFGGNDSPLYAIARNSGLPKWLLVADNTDLWPGYRCVSRPIPGGTHRHGRCLCAPQVQ